MKNTIRPQEINLQDIPLFKNMTPAELETLHNYQRILREKNIQRSKRDQLFDMMRITASTRRTHNSDPKTQGSVVINDKILEALTKENWDDKINFSALQSLIYQSKREIRHKDPFTQEDIKRPSPEAKSVLDAQARQGKLAKVEGTNYDDYWVRKYSQGYLDAKAANPYQEQHRFILNVNPSEDLFKKLDDFADKYNCLYKSPQLISWGQRLDTVVLYTSDNRIAEQQKELIKIASPHIRKERDPNALDGTKLADGIFTAKEVDRGDISALADRAQQNNLAALADTIRKNLNKSSAHPLSLGEFLSYKEIIDSTEAGKAGNFNIVVPQRLSSNTSESQTFDAIYNGLADKNPALAKQLKHLSEQYKQSGKTDWLAMEKDPTFIRIKSEANKFIGSRKTPTYIEAVDLKEMDLLKGYDNYLRNNNITRSDEEVFLDKLRLLLHSRLGYRVSQNSYESQSKENWDTCRSLFNPLGRLAYDLYSLKKNVAYDTDLFDKNKQPTREADGTLPSYAMGGQTEKGDELAKYLFYNKDMDVQGTDLSEHWIYRLPKNRGKNDFANNPVIERFAINASPDKELIPKLDAFAKKYKLYYKTAKPTAWHKRNDPVVIYCTHPQTSEMIEELKNIVKPHIRRSKPERMNDLDGTLIADGLVRAKEPNRDDISVLHKEISAVSPAMAAALDADVADGSNKNTPLSLGQFEAYRRLLDIYKGFKTSKTLGNQRQTVRVSNEPLNEEHTGTDRTFKKALREVFEPSARKEGSVYKEDIKANNYVAKITHKDGSVDHISASSATNLSLSGKDKDGNPRIPDMQRFRDIAEYTHRKNTFVSFGDIKTPEFKAKLMLACMEHEPPVAMRGQPKVNKEFLDSLTDKAVKKMLEDAINKGKKTVPQQQSTIINQNILRGGRDSR